MPVNVEIKARVSNPFRLHTLAAALSDDSGTLLQQDDTFFHTRLLVRCLHRRVAASPRRRVISSA